MGRGKCSFKGTPTQKGKDAPQWSGIQGFQRDFGDPSLQLSAQLHLCRHSFRFQRERTALEKSKGEKLNFSFKYEADNRCL